MTSHALVSNGQALSVVDPAASPLSQHPDESNACIGQASGAPNPETLAPFSIAHAASSPGAMPDTATNVLQRPWFISSQSRSRRSCRPEKAGSPPWWAEDGDDWNAYPAEIRNTDKLKSKNAVRAYLASVVRTDWEFAWPPHDTSQTSSQPEHSSSQPDPVSSQGTSASPTSASQDQPNGIKPVDAITTRVSPFQSPTAEHAAEEVLRSGYEVDNDDAGSVSSYSSISDTDAGLRYRTEWSSGLSGEDEATAANVRFDSPEDVGIALRAGALAKKAQRRRAVRQEAKWNKGLACFEARRNAWTGARTVRVRCKPVSPPPKSPLSARRLFFRGSISAPANPANPHPSTPRETPLPSPLSLRKSDSSDSADVLSRNRTGESASLGPTATIQVILPQPRPILPPTPMRMSITPKTYLVIYDKVIREGLVPGCPINLADVLHACVAGWKRDDEWPPKPAAAAESRAQQPRSSTPSSSQQATALHARQRRRSLVQVLVGKGSSDPAAEDCSSSHQQSASKLSQWSKMLSIRAKAGHGHRTQT